MPKDKLTEYYIRTAEFYDSAHVRKNDEHYNSLTLTASRMHELRPISFLDVGCGTGRTLGWLEENFTDAELYGVDPVPALLEKSREKSKKAVLAVGTAEHLPHRDKSIDIVIATGIMHHVDNPTQCIKEMFRVATKAVLISDHNNFSFGSGFARRLRLVLHACNLLRPFQYVKQGFSHRGYSEDDGFWYPFSLLNHHSQLCNLSEQVWIFPTRRPVPSPLGCMFTEQGHLGVWCILPTKTI